MTDRKFLTPLRQLVPPCLALQLRRPRQVRPLAYRDPRRPKIETSRIGGSGSEAAGREAVETTETSVRTLDRHRRTHRSLSETCLSRKCSGNPRQLSEQCPPEIELSQ